MFVKASEIAQDSCSGMRSSATPYTALAYHVSLLVGFLPVFFALHVFAYRQEAFIGYSEKYGKAKT